MGRSLKDARVLVLGGSSGIGLATAKAAAAAGANVTLASRSNDKVNAAAMEVGKGAVGVPIDTTNDTALEAFFSKQPEWDHIVVSVAAGRSAGLQDLSLQDAYGNMNAKFWTAYKTARFARIAPEGSLTLVSGFLSQRPNKDALLQGCINAALESLGRGLALALSPVRVNTVSPGWIMTERQLKQFITPAVKRLIRRSEFDAREATYRRVGDTDVDRTVTEVLAELN